MVHIIFHTTLFHIIPLPSKQKLDLKFVSIKVSQKVYWYKRMSLNLLALPLTGLNLLLLQSIIWRSYFNRDWQAPINYHKCIQTPVSQVSNHVRYFYKSYCSKMQFKARWPCFKNPSRVLCTATPHGIHSNCLVLSHKLLYNLVPTFLPPCLTLYLTCSKESQTNAHLQSPKCCAGLVQILHMPLCACTVLSLIPT